MSNSKQEICCTVCCCIHQCEASCYCERKRRSMTILGHQQTRSSRRRNKVTSNRLSLLPRSFDIVGYSNRECMEAPAALGQDLVLFQLPYSACEIPCFCSESPLRGAKTKAFVVRVEVDSPHRTRKDESCSRRRKTLANNFQWFSSTYLDCIKEDSADRLEDGSDNQPGVPAHTSSYRAPTI